MFTSGLPARATQLDELIFRTTILVLGAVLMGMGALGMGGAAAMHVACLGLYGMVSYVALDIVAKRRALAGPYDYLPSGRRRDAGTAQQLRDAEDAAWSR